MDKSEIFFLHIITIFYGNMFQTGHANIQGLFTLFRRNKERKMVHSRTVVPATSNYKNEVEVLIVWTGLFIKFYHIKLARKF